MFSIQNLHTLDSGPVFTLPSIPDFRLERKELADLFGISVSTIKRLGTEGLIAPQHINSRTLFYTLETVQAMRRLGYRMDPEKAKCFGVPGLTPPPEPSPAPMPKPEVEVSGAREPAGLPAASVLGFDLAAHQLLATFRWLLRQPEIREEILRIARQEGFHLGR